MLSNFLILQKRVILSFLVPAVLTAAIFSDNRGRTVEGEVLGLEGDRVTFFRKQDQKEYQISLSVFSLEDQKKIVFRFGDQFFMPPLMGNPNLIQQAQQIDRILAVHWGKRGLKGNSFISDEVFLRRAYLKIIGRSASAREAKDFLADQSRDKRTQLVNDLLVYYGYVLGEFPFWADLLRVRSNIVRGEGLHYVQWIKDNIRLNTPYHLWVREMLQARGDINQNPASGYYLTDAQMPLDNLAYTMETFSATALSCAQCHDHPFEQWTQQQFYELASFRSQFKTNGLSPEYDKLAKNLKKNPSSKASRAFEGAFLTKAFYSKKFAIRENEELLHFPDDYQYDSRLQGAKVTPKLLYSLPNSRFHNSKDPFVDWLTDKNNNKFVWTISNRIWQKVMGASLFPDPQNFSNAEQASIPELILYLGNLMKTLNFDIKQFYQVLYHTQFFQRKTGLFSSEEASNFTWQGPVFQRMTPEQVWDSMVAMVIPNSDYRLGNFFQQNTRGDFAEKLFEFPVANITQAIKKLNLESKETAYVYKKSRELYDFLDISVQNNNLPKNPHHHPYWDSFSPSVVRAAELESPSKSSHILRSFGQSERILSNTSSRSANLSQTLVLLNSEIINRLIGRKAWLYQGMEASQNSNSKLELIFLTVLNRYPNKDEVNKFMPYLRKFREDGPKDILWVLCNSPQFLFIL